MGLESKLNLEDIREKFFDLDKRVSILEKEQEKNSEIFAYLMKKYNVTSNEILAEGKTLC